MKKFTNDPAITLEFLLKSSLFVKDDAVYSFEEDYDPQQICPVCSQPLGKCITMRIGISGTQHIVGIHRTECFDKLFKR